MFKEIYRITFTYYLLILDKKNKNKDACDSHK